MDLRTPDRKPGRHLKPEMLTSTKQVIILISTGRVVYRVTAKRQNYLINPNMSSICKFNDC